MILETKIKDDNHRTKALRQLLFNPSTVSAARVIPFMRIFDEGYRFIKDKIFSSNSILKFRTIFSYSLSKPLA